MSSDGVILAGAGPARTAAIFLGNQHIHGTIVKLHSLAAKVIDTSPRLQPISSSGVGYDDIDVSAATRRGIAVCTTPCLNHNAVAEYTMNLMLQCARKLLENL